ncbi:hypothetical protein MLD38_038097 [Melastoma candidum]|uniref:Uncharacterized protein n=1 Tax=Melastoma candidum TaxID=119954 RepID=A0ACB9KYU7_9MYRT|nr:hypothetical protein MLD38_038097 [Melastoma candidum]
MLCSAFHEYEMDDVMLEINSKMREFTIAVTEYQNLDDALDFADWNCCLRGLANEDLPEGPRFCDVEEQDGGEFRSSEISSEELTAQTVNLKDFPSVEGYDLLNIAEEQESAEIKCISSNSEEEFLQLTLGYQQVLSERDAAISVQDKLESLCQELQRQNKMLMDECKRLSTEGQNLRLDLSFKFQDAIKEMNNKLQRQKNECLSQLEENEMLKINLKQLADQYALSQKHHEQQLKQKSLELQIADLKIKQQEEKATQERARTNVYADQISQLLETEEDLRSQLTADGEKFQQFQEALSKSNEVFETFNHEIEKMAKSTKDLRKENEFLKSKCERTDLAIIELVEDGERTKKQLEKIKNQKEKLESLCRSLQAERKQNAANSATHGPFSA